MFIFIIHDIIIINITIDYNNMHCYFVCYILIQHLSKSSCFSDAMTFVMRPTVESFYLQYVKRSYVKHMQKYFIKLRNHKMVR